MSFITIEDKIDACIRSNSQKIFYFCGILCQNKSSVFLMWNFFPKTNTMSSNLLITLVQTDLHWENKVANLAMLGEKISGIQEPTEIVVLPEMFSTGFSMRPELLAEEMEGNTVNWMKAIAREKKIILAGSAIISSNKENYTTYFNRLIWMLPTGQSGYYDKRHCFGFAGEDEHYTPGNTRFIASAKGWKINLQVCYDLRFPVWARQAGPEKPEYDVLIYVANWPEKRSNAWRTLLQARAIENQCYVIGVNRVGKDGNDIYYAGESMVVDPMGQILYTKKDEEDIFTVALDKEYLRSVREKLPFLKDGDGFRILESENEKVNPGSYRGESKT
jgi:predicted amidohydrolase